MKVFKEPTGAIQQLIEESKKSAATSSQVRACIDDLNNRGITKLDGIIYVVDPTNMLSHVAPSAKTMCFLLGSSQCKAYHVRGFEDYLDALEHVSFDGSLYKLRLEGDPVKDAEEVSKLAHAIIGWNDVLEISEKEHDLILLNTK